MIIKNANVLDENFVMRKTDVEIDDGRIIRVQDDIKYTEADMVLDCEGFTLVPGFIDVHIHGSVGRDTCDASREALEEMSAYLVSKGVTGFCPTTLTIDVKDIKETLGAVRDCMDNPPEGSTILGVNLEGPFISEAKKGAHNKDFIVKPSIELFNELQAEFNNIIKIIDVAPEEDTDLHFISEVSKSCTVSIAHTNASYEQAKKSFDSGITHATHLYNAMSGFTHREPGVVGAVFDDDRVYAELICDGYHVVPPVVRTTFKLLGDRICVVSDALMMSGMPEGAEAELGGLHASVKGGTAVLDNGTIAGSITNLHDELKNLVSWGIPLETAVKAMSYNPAKQLGLENEIGSIAAGKKADIVILDENLEIVAVYH